MNGIVCFILIFLFTLILSHIHFISIPSVQKVFCFRSCSKILF